MSNEVVSERAMSVLAMVEPHYRLLTHTAQSQVLGRLLWLHLEGVESKEAMRAHMEAIAAAARGWRTER